MFPILLFCILLPGLEVAASRPNIVFIIADDMGWDDVSFHGSDQILTPNIDLLAYTGVALERYYSHCICTPSRSALLTGKFGHGWDDVSFHGSDQILTPNIDLLAYTGVALERYYSHCICTPSRSALLTGKFGHVTGMQGYPLTNAEDRALPLTEKILPQYFKEHGYATHLVGKWHVGQARVEYLPTSRGFDSHFGHRGGYIDYYEYDLLETWNIGDVSGYDLFRNLSVAWDVNGYITDVYTEEAKSIIRSHDVSKPLFLMLAHNAPHSGNEQAPLQAPPEVVRTMRHIELPQRRYYAAMVKKLDDSVGDVMRALLEKGILENTIIVFVSDNGGITSQLWANYASNWPLRGLKTTPFEGGIRVNGLIWSKNLTQGQHLWKGYMHVVDWLPTLSRAVEIDPPVNIDGIDLWESIVSNGESKRDLIVEIDDYTGFASIINGDFKLVTGDVRPNYSKHDGLKLRGITGIGPSYTGSIEASEVYSVLSSLGIPFSHADTNVRNLMRISCNVDASAKDICYPGNGTICLYNIKEDPCEMTDISSSNPDIVENLNARLQIEFKRVIPRSKPHESNLKALPSLHNFTWNVWKSSTTL